MEKRDDVRDVVYERWGKGNFRPFSAGQIAKQACVSTNTAKKYLRELCECHDPAIFAGHRTMNNGIVAQVFAFTEDWLKRWSGHTKVS